jgi:hypothetical protein
MLLVDTTSRKVGTQDSVMGPHSCKYFGHKRAHDSDAALLAENGQLVGEVNFSGPERDNRAAEPHEGEQGSSATA